MKIKIEIDESAAEDEVIIRCRGLTKQVAAVQRAVRDVTNIVQDFVFRDRRERDQRTHPG